MAPKCGARYGSGAMAGRRNGFSTLVLSSVVDGDGFCLLTSVLHLQSVIYKIKIVLGFPVRRIVLGPGGGMK